MATKNDTIHDTVVVYVEKDIKKVDDSTLVEEVLHRYDRVAHDLKSHDSTPAMVSIFALIAILISIYHRRQKNKNK